MSIECTRVWEETKDGKWRSREMTSEELKRRDVFERWSRGEIKHKQVLSELELIDA